VKEAGILGLQQYNEKRNFDKTKEPIGKAVKSGKQLRFVVQHHMASREHYDLRLEQGGVLKSWAVPKGPSRSPADKRLAIQVEDHPFSYRNFEGIIPKGQYGGGTVMLWDEGYYELLEFSENAIKFKLHGQRLKGKWSLVRMQNQEFQWLLRKEKDRESRETAAINRYKTSVRTGRTMDEITTGNATPKKRNPFQQTDLQLCKLVKELPKEESWLYELKYDGYRVLSFVEGGRARLLTRNGHDYTEKFKPVAKALTNLSTGQSFVVDGEMVVPDINGCPDFGALQHYIKQPGVQALQYIIFDLLALDGVDLRSTPLLQRKEKLEQLLQGAPQQLQYSAHVEGSGEQLLQQACKVGLEGIVGKQADSVYTGQRDWIKLKCKVRQEFVIGGYTRSGKRETGISSLLLGAHSADGLTYCGRAGGFSQQDMNMLATKFRPLARKTSPFSRAPSARAKENIVWLSPKLAAEVNFVEWTQQGLLRQAKFCCLREDKAPEQIMREDSVDTVEGVIITNSEKIFSENPRVTKKDLALYYQAVAPRMLPYIENRIISAIRCPGGAAAPCFFKKHPAANSQGIHTIETGDHTYYYVTNAFGFISELQMNTVEFHIWGSRAQQLEQPDIMVFDFDPDEGLELAIVRQGVRDLKRILDNLGMNAYLKTSGGKGYHVVAPMQAAQNWESVRDLAKGIVDIMVETWPERYTGNVRKVNRHGKIFVDWLRNTRGATSVAPYSVRMRPGLPVSCPIAWSELDKVVPDGINMTQALKRLKRKDPWENFYSFKT